MPAVNSGRPRSLSLLSARLVSLHTPPTDEDAAIPPGAVPLANSLDRQALPGAVALITFTLIAINIYQSYFFTIVKTYALSGLLIISGFLLLAHLTDARRKGLAVAAGALMALAACTRLSAIAVLPAR